MIKYKVIGSYENNANPDKVKVEPINKEFYNSNPLIARREAIRFYSDFLDELKESGETIRDKFKIGGGTDLFDELEFCVKIVITDPLDIRWDGFSLENGSRDYIEFGSEINDYVESSYEWTILGVGFLTAAHFLMDGLNDEMEIYNFLDIDKKEFEVEVNFIAPNESEMKPHLILKVPVDWDTENLIRTYDNIKNNDKLWKRNFSFEKNKLEVMLVNRTGNSIQKELLKALNDLINIWDDEHRKEG